MNPVDVSPEKVASEWADLEEKYGLLPEEDEAGAGNFSEETPESGEAEIILSSEERAVKEHLTASLIKGSLGMVLGVLQVTDLPENITDDFCASWAVVIVKRFPDNPITDFMEAYGDLIAAGSASLILFGAIRKSRMEIAVSQKELKERAKDAMRDKVDEYENEQEAA